MGWLGGGSLWGEGQVLAILLGPSHKKVKGIASASCVGLAVLISIADVG